MSTAAALEGIEGSWRMVAGGDRGSLLRPIARTSVAPASPIWVSPPEQLAAGREHVERLLWLHQDHFATAWFKVRGDAGGYLGILATPPDAMRMVELFSGTAAGSVRSLGSMERLIFGGAATVVASSLLDTLGGSPDPRIWLSFPAVLLDRPARALDLPSETSDPSRSIAQLSRLLVSDGRRRCRALLAAFLDPLPRRP